MPSIQRCVSFLRGNRVDFTEIPTPIANIAVFRNFADAKRAWNHFVPFQNNRPQPRSSASDRGDALEGKSTLGRSDFAKRTRIGHSIKRANKKKTNHPSR